MRIERNNMVKCLHDDRAVVKQRCTTVDKRLTGHVVGFRIAQNLLNLTIIRYFQAGNAIAGTGPDVMMLILYHRVNHLVQQSVKATEHLGLRLWRSVEFQSYARTYPRPAATVGVDAVDALAFKLRGLHGLLLQDVEQFVGTWCIPFVSAEWRREGLGV